MFLYDYYSVNGKDLMGLKKCGVRFVSEHVRLHCFISCHYGTLGGTLCYKADLHYREHHFVCYTEYQKSWVTSHIMIVPGGDNCVGHINHIVSIQQIVLLLNHLHWSLFLLKLKM